MTGLALSYFAQEKVEIAILEVGLGGRLDATNVVDPAVSGISIIDFDHTRELGTTIERIAREKAGIIKEGVPTVVAPQREEALRVIEEVAHKRGSRLYLVGKDVRLEDLLRKRFSVSTWRTKYEGLRTNLVGRHQRLNIAQALGMIEVIAQKGIFQKGPERIRKALEHVRLPGRFEVLRRRPYLVVDGAHNPVSAGALAEAVRGEFPGRQVILVLGMAADKDVEGFLAEVLPLSRSVFTTRIASPRTLEPQALRKRVIRSADAASGLKPGDVEATGAVGVAIQRALSMAKEEDLVLVTGSFYLVGEVKLIFPLFRTADKK
jgi:dihydrofolate synthase/folylpolyglutamate synthase